jgi:hypothetical protein
MHVRATTLRGRGVEVVEGTATVVPEKLRLRRSPRREVVVVGKTAEIGVDEIGAIIGFLRANRVKIDTIDKERRTTVEDVIKEMAKRGWLSAAGLAATERLRSPKPPDAVLMAQPRTAPPPGQPSSP